MQQRYGRDRQCRQMSPYRDLTRGGSRVYSSLALNLLEFACFDPHLPSSRSVC